MPRLITPLIWLAALALLGYVAVGVFFYFEQNALLYFPQFTHDHADHPDFELRRDDGVVLRGWVMNPGQERALLYFGGNGDAVQAMRQDYARIAPGRTVYLVGYRGYSASDGTPGEQALFGDALALYDSVKARHSTVAAIGRSLGSGVAVYLASRRPVERLVLVTPYDSIARVAQSHFPIFPAGWLMHDRYESWRYAPAVHCPVLVVQAMDDGVIRAPRTAALVAALPSPPTMLQLAHQDHNSVVGTPEYAAALADFLR